MHWKAVAEKFRMACGVEEPDGAEEALGATMPEHAGTAAAREPSREGGKTGIEEQRQMMKMQQNDSREFGGAEGEGRYGCVFQEESL